MSPNPADGCAVNPSDGGAVSSVEQSVTNPSDRGVINLLEQGATKTEDGGAVVAADEKDASKNFVCVFQDETNVNCKAVKFHQNISGTFTITQLYELAAQNTNYKYGTFFLAYKSEHDDILIDYECDDTLSDILKDSTEKTFTFLIKQKDGTDPVTVLFDDMNATIAQESEDNDVETYASSFFKLEGNNETILPSKTFTLPAPSYSTYTNISTMPVKSTTGFVGLVNQAMTCYLNSLLQTLFMSPEFRNALYRWRYAGNRQDASKSIPYQLQKLFLKLETSKKRAVETTDLTKSFGWDSSEAWQQHDVQELCRVMFDALESTLKDTDQANLINQLYQGEMKDYVKCLKCGHENSRQDNYLDISVDIRPFGSKEPHEDLDEALQAFVAPETLNGNNQYFCENCNSKQDAHKGLKFVTFPYLLTIQLKRFTFDHNTLQRIKLHDRLTFPFEIDLNNYVEKEECNDSVMEEECECPSEEKQPADDAVISEDEKLSCASNAPVIDFSKGPYIYELFSVLVHSGSALGGHYYAYIKSFPDDKWFCFNDQYVSEISLQEVQKSYGGGDKHGVGYYSSNYSSSTNAYMLMYRKIDNSQNKDFIRKPTWSSSLTELSNDILKDEQDEHTKLERDKNMCKIRLFVFHPKTLNKIEAKLEVHKDNTLNEATEIAWKTLELDELIPLSECRLVKYDDYSGSYEKSYEGEEGTVMSKLLGGIRLTYSFDLLLEWKQKDKQFQVYEPGGTTLKVYVIDLEEEAFDEPRLIHVPLSYTVAQLKERLDSETGLSSETMRVAVWKEYHDFNLLENPKRTLKLEGFYRSAKIFLEGLMEEDRHTEFKKSKFYERLTVYHHTIKLNIILPFEDDETHEKKELALNVDKRITLIDLKQKIEKQIGIEADMFRVYRLYSNNQEFECTRLDEQLTSYLDDTKIIVKLGRALKHGESRIKVYLLNIHEKEHMKFLMEVIIYSNLSVRALKEQQILPELKKKENIEVSVEKLRVRKKSYKNPCRIYQDTSLFEKDIVIGYSSELFVEILEDNDTVLSDDYLSIYIRKWNPSTYILDPFHEIVLYKDTSVKNLKLKLEERSGIPADFIHIAKGRGIFPCSVSLLDVHHELDWNPTASKLGEYPMSVSDDGGVIYYRDSRDIIKYLNEEERSEIRNKEKHRNPKSSGGFYRKEKALKIYTNGSKR